MVNLRYNLFSFSFFIAFLLIGSMTLLSSQMVWAEDKSFVSEIAKNKAGLTVVYSGAATLPAARELANGVMATNPKGKTAANVALVPADKFMGSAPLGMTYVFMLVGDECGEAFTPGVSAALPADIRSPDSTLSVFTSRITSDKKNAGTFSIVLYAPDAERFARMQQDFVARRFGSNFRAMGDVSRRARTNRIALFSTPEVRPLLQGWGVLPGNSSLAFRGAVADNEVWNSVNWHDLAERPTLTPENLAERAEVYVVDRAQTPKVVLPPQATSALAGTPIKGTTIVSAHSRSEDGRPIAVISAPNPLLLEGRLRQFPNLERLPNGVSTFEAVDLRRVGRTVLLVNGDAPKSEREAIRLLLAREMRQRLGVLVDERGSEFFNDLESEDALRSILGESSRTRRERARREARSEFIWMFTLTEYSGTTQFSPSETCITPVPPPFSRSKPLEPSEYESAGFFKRRRKSDEKRAADMQQWHRELESWEEDRRRYEERTSSADYQWRREVRCDESATTRGVLRLVSLFDKGKVEWERECDGTSTNSRKYKSDTISVRGRDGRPSSLDSPAALTACANDVMRRAAFQAGQRGFEALSVEAWLPDGKSLGATPVSDIEPIPSQSANESAPVIFRSQSAPMPAVASGPKVAAINGKTAYLTVGTKQGLKFNDLVVVALETLEIKDPDTGRILDFKVTDRLTLRVVGGVTTAECIAHTPADEAKWDKMKAGLSISWQAKRKPLVTPGFKPAGKPRSKSGR